MSVETGLLLVLLVAVGAIVTLLAREHRQRLSAREDERSVHAETLRAIRDLERFFDRKIDRLTDRLVERPEAPRSADDPLRELASGLLELNRRWEGRTPAEGPPSSSGGVGAGPQSVDGAHDAGAAEMPSPDEPPESPAPAPAPVRPTLSPGEPERSRRLADVLNTPDFLGDIWPKMVGPFEGSRELLGDFLQRQGVGTTQVAVHPPLPPEGRDHWLFLVVERASPNGKLERVLIPRSYSRYDPAVHDHLFRVDGRGTSLENYLRECHAVALLKPGRELLGFIDQEVVETRGVVVV